MATDNNTELISLSGSHKDYNGIKQKVDQSTQSQPISAKDAKEDMPFGGLEKLSNIQGLMHLLKAFVATGYLSLPYAVKQIGLWAGIICLLFTGVVTESSVLMLTKSCQIIKKRENMEYIDYSQMMELSFAAGPKFLHRFSTKAKALVNVFLVIANLSYSAVYLDLMESYLSQVVSYYVSTHIDDKLYLCLLTLIVWPLCCITSLWILTPFSTFANISNFTIFIIAFQYIIRDLPDVTTRTAFKSPEGLMLYAGISMFAFEGISMVVPLASRMKQPEDYGGWNGVTGLACTIFIVAFTAVGFYGYLRFGEATQPSVLLNLPTAHALYRSIKILGVIMLMPSITLTIFVPAEIVWTALRDISDSLWWGNYGVYVIRTGLVMTMLVFTLLVPNVGLLMPFVGALCGSSISFIFPPFISILVLLVDKPVTLKDKSKRFIYILYCVLLLLVGLSAAGSGTYVAMWQILEYYRSSNLTTVSPH